jgi:hypothetical protein
MKIPNIDQARVSEAKIKEYLLSETHPDGREKAAFFTRFGFSVAQWEQLAQALLNHAATYEVMQTTSTRHGTKYVIEGRLFTPNGRNPLVRTVWIIEAGTVGARLVTAYPVKR